MKDQGISLNKDCPCVQEQCPILGNCVVCVQNHLKGRHHIPECFQNMLRPGVQAMAALLELKTTEGRPDPDRKFA